MPAKSGCLTVNVCVFFLSFFQISFVQFSAVYARTLATDPDIDSSLLLAQEKASITARVIHMYHVPKPARAMVNSTHQAE